MDFFDKKSAIISFLSSKSNKYGNPFLTGFMDRYIKAGGLIDAKVEDLEEYAVEMFGEEELKCNGLL